MHTNSFSKFGDDFPIAGLSVKQFIELCVSLGFGNRPNSYPNKPESPPPEIMGINDVIKLTGYSKATIYKFTHQRLIPFHRPAHGGRRLVFIRQEIEDWMKENSIPTVGQYCKEQLKKLNNEFIELQEEAPKKRRRQKTRESFVCFISFYESIKLMPERLHLRAFRVLMDYAFYQKEPPTKTPTRIMQSFVSWRKQVDVNSQKYDRKVESNWGGKDGDEKADNDGT